MSSLLQLRSEAAVTRSRHSEPRSPLPDIDSVDKENPLAATEYVGDIFVYYKRIEPLVRVAPDYMTKQVHLKLFKNSSFHFKVLTLRSLLALLVKQPIPSQGSCSSYLAKMIAVYCLREVLRYICSILICLVQSDINDKMRAILVDWLVEVHLKFKVTSSSLPNIPMF